LIPAILLGLGVKQKINHLFFTAAAFALVLSDAKEENMPFDLLIKKLKSLEAPCAASLSNQVKLRSLALIALSLSVDLRFATKSNLALHQANKNIDQSPPIRDRCIELY